MVKTSESELEGCVVLDSATVGAAVVEGGLEVDTASEVVSFGTDGLGGGAGYPLDESAKLEPADETGNEVGTESVLV